MTQDTIRVGVVGAGANTRDRHIPGLQAIDGVEIVAVCNRSMESGERVAKRFGIERVCTNWQDIVQAEDVDAVVIGTWPYMHRLVTVAALEADKHVMCEARMAMNASEAHCMYNALRSRPHLVAQIVPSPFSLRVDRTIQRLIRDGWLGDVLVVDIHAGGTFIDQDDTMHWRHNMDFSGLNVMTMGIWYEAMLRWVGEATSIIAQGKTFTPMRKDEQGRLTGVRIPDHIDIIADLACGGQAHIQVSNVTGFGEPPSASHLRQRRHAAFQRRRPDGRTARRQRPERNRCPRARGRRLAGRRGVYQRHPRAGRDHPHRFRHRRQIHGVHRGRLSQPAQRRRSEPAASVEAVA